MGKGKIRQLSSDPAVAKLFDLRDRVDAHAKTDVMFPRGRHYVLLEYAFRMLARRRRHLGLDAIKELAPWLAKFVRSRMIKGGPGILLADCFWDFTSDQERAWLATQQPLAHLVPPPIEQVLVKAAWHDKDTAFERLRTRDPAGARALLEKPPAAMTESDRRSLIRRLRDGLSEADREFLEREKSWLLVYLPGSSLWNELGQRADSLVTIADGKLRIAPPANFEDLFARMAFKKDAVDSSWSDFSQQEFWAYQFLNLVPLDYLEQRWRLDPTAILGLFLDDTANQKYRWAIHGNIHARRNADWSRALLDRYQRFGPEVLVGSQYLSLARHLPAPERETYLEPLVDDETNYTPNEFDDALDHVWTPDFTRRQVVRAACGRKPLATSPPVDPSFAGVFTPLVHHGNQEAIADLIRLMPSDKPEVQAARDELAAAWRERDEILSRF